MESKELPRPTESRFSWRLKSKPPSANHSPSQASTSLTTVERPRPTFSRIDNLHNFGVALELLANFGEGSQIVAPFKAICGGLKVLVDIAEVSTRVLSRSLSLMIYQTVQQNDNDIHDLHTKLARQLGNLEQQYTTLLATKSKVAGKEVNSLVKALEAYAL